MKISQLARAADALQQPVNIRALEGALQSQFDGEQIVSVTELDGGKFNNAYQVETRVGRWLLKVAPPEDATLLYHERHLMQREQQIAPALSAASPLVPDYGDFFTLDGRSAFLQAWVGGQPWEQIAQRLSEAQNAALWQQLGKFARVLHQVEGASFGFPSPMSGFASASQFVTDTVDGLMEDCRHAGVCYPEIREFATLLDAHHSVLNDCPAPKLLHGDLWPPNVLVECDEGEAKIAAVIDGERAFWGDPISDWVLILYPVHDDFWQGYGDNLLAKSDPRKLALYRGMYFIVNILEAWRDAQPDDSARRHLIEVIEILRQGSG